MTDDALVGVGVRSVDNPPYALEDAKHCIRSYCFDSTAFVLDPVAPAYGPPPRANERPRNAYRTYDCIPAANGSSLAGVDLLVAAGINGRIDVDVVASLLTVAAEVSESIARLDEQPSRAFWDLEEVEVSVVAARSSPPPPGTFAYNLGRAWFLIRSVPDCGESVAHKVLHHKRPALFPLLDSTTLGWLGEDPWLTIWRDLSMQAEQFSQLEAWFRNLAAAHGTVSLTRLRLHDILLWSRARGVA